jgi:hypothetical protein
MPVVTTATTANDIENVSREVEVQATPASAYFAVDSILGSWSWYPAAPVATTAGAAPVAVDGPGKGNVATASPLQAINN